MKLTIQKFYRVSGGSTQGRGVAADVVVPSPYDGLDIYESDLDYSLAWDRITPAPHVRTGDPGPFLDGLRARSTKRIAASEDFAKLGRTISERTRLQAEREVSLVLDERRTEHEALLDTLGADPAEGDDEDAPDAFVLDEALAVLLDYTLAQQQPPHQGPG